METRLLRRKRAVAFLILLVNIIFSPFPFFTLNFPRVLPYENKSLEDQQYITIHLELANSADFEAREIRKILCYQSLLF